MLRDGIMITSNNLVHHEFIGLKVHATSLKNKSLNLNGTIIDETKNIIKIEDENNCEKIIPKRGSIFLFELPNGEKIEINGNILSIRPEDRIKKRFKKI
jgi:ribonuclease P protein subunit POP4